jgi:hypothetical protein
MTPINDGAPIPREGQERWWKVYGPEDDKVLRMVFLAPTFTGRWTHWDGAVQSCEESPDCPFCKAGSPPRWTGYIAAYSFTHKDEIVAALTRAACEDLIPILERGESLRGLTVELFRKRPPQGKKTKPNARVYCRVIGREPEEKCPQPFEIVSSLNRLFGMNAGRASGEANKRVHDMGKARYLPAPLSRPLQRGEH